MLFKKTIVIGSSPRAYTLQNLRLLTRFTVQGLNSFMQNKPHIQSKSSWLPPHLCATVALVGASCLGGQCCSMQDWLHVSSPQQRAQHLLALYKSVNRKKLSGQFQIDFYVLQPKSIMSSAVGTYHLILQAAQSNDQQPVFWGMPVKSP